MTMKATQNHPALSLIVWSLRQEKSVVSGNRFKVEVVKTMAAEEVENVVNNQADKEEVGICFIEKCVLHSQNGRMTGSMTSNEGTTSNKSQ